MPDEITSLVDVEAIAEHGGHQAQAPADEGVATEQGLAGTLDFDPETLSLRPNASFRTFIRQVTTAMETPSHGFPSYEGVTLPEVAQTLGLTGVELAVYPSASERSNYYDLYLTFSAPGRHFRLPAEQTIAEQIPNVSAVSEWRRGAVRAHACTVRGQDAQRDDFGTNLSTEFGQAVIKRRVDDQIYAQPDGEARAKAAAEEFFALANFYIAYLKDQRDEAL